MSLYPKLTFAYRGLFNPWSTKTEKKTYEDMGFDQAYSLDEWTDYDKHICRKDGSCPRTVRSTEDSHIFFLPFATSDISGRIPMQPYDFSSIWSLEAGAYCIDQSPYTSLCRIAPLTFMSV